MYDVHEHDEIVAKIVQSIEDVFIDRSNIDINFCELLPQTLFDKYKKWFDDFNSSSAHNFIEDFLVVADTVINKK